MNAKWTSDDVPGRQGRLAVVTGASTGLGFETARVLAARGASVVLAVRDIEKGNRAAARIAGTAPGANIMVQPLDLADHALGIPNLELGAAGRSPGPQ